MKKHPVCPVCYKRYDGWPAISRKDNKTKICPDCGRNEALEIYFRFVQMTKKENSDD